MLRNKLTILDQAIEVLKETLKESVQVNGISSDETIAISRTLDNHILEFQKLKSFKNKINNNESTLMEDVLSFPKCM